MSIGRRAEKDVARSASVSRALVLERMGEPLRLVARPVPTPARGQIIVRNLATSINFHDVLNLQGVMPNVAWLRVPFSDNCGQIVAVGADCGGFRVGERVIANFFPDWLDGEPQPRYCDIVFGDQIDGFLAGPYGRRCAVARACSRAPVSRRSRDAALRRPHRVAQRGGRGAGPARARRRHSGDGAAWPCSRCSLPSYTAPEVISSRRPTKAGCRTQAGGGPHP